MELRAKRSLLSVLCVILSLCTHAAAGDQQAPEVHTALGSLRGAHVSVKGKESGVHAFLGVPFAKPPLGPALRLRAPQPVEAWGGMRDATKQPFMCVQGLKMLHQLLDQFGPEVVEVPDISEDCLYLNIYTPANRRPDAKLPVMVWIHGGGFVLGSASLYDGSALSAYQDVVVVLIQYRLGMMGFLSTGDEQVAGNFGLLDQVEALRWIQQHIHNFGGNPGSVTIFGESAGGMSVSALYLAPLANGLFHRGIAESGTIAMDTIVSNNPLPMAKMAVTGTGCDNDSTEKLADCVRNLDFKAIKAVAQDDTLRYPINIDGHFLTKPVEESFQTGEFNIVPFMTGINDDEGGWLMAQFMAPPNWTEGIDKEAIVKQLSLIFSDPKTVPLRDLLVEEYIGAGEDRVKNRDGFTELLGDSIFNIPAVKAANAHRDAGAAVYLYQYHHAPRILQARRPSFVGSDHGDEVLAVLGYCLTTTHVKLNVSCEEDEVEFNKAMMSYWGNFARTGSPNGEGLAHWPKYGAEEEYLEISLKEQTVARQLKRERFVFMTQTMPAKLQEQAEKMEHVEL